jgi:hypothetical protein
MACMTSSIYFWVSSDGFSPLQMLFLIASYILIIVDARQKKEPQLPRLLPQ